MKTSSTYTALGLYKKREKKTGNSQTKPIIPSDPFVPILDASEEFRITEP